MISENGSSGRTKSGSRRKTILFAGGGHAHLYSLRRTHKLREAGFDVVLVNPSRFLYYSGMAPGLLSRIYRPEEDRIDVKYLVEKGGGTFVKDRIKKVHTDDSLVELDSGRTIHYDAMTMCLGSGVPNKDFAMHKDHLTPVKPVENMENLHWELRSLERNGHRPRVLVIGGGPAGCEMACNSKKVLEDHGIDGDVVIANADSVLLKSAPKRAQREILKFMRDRGIEVMLDSEIVSIEKDAAYTRDGRKIGFDLFILAVGIKPPALFRESGLRVAHDDGLWINEYLQSVTDPKIFGGGDSVSFKGEPLTRLGVFAIRQGPVLFHNLQAFLKGEPMQEFKPQSVFLYILNLGNYEGLAIWGPLVVRGKKAWDLKNYIDTKFMKLFQYPEDRPGEVREYFERLSEEEAADVGYGIWGPGAAMAAIGGAVAGEGYEAPDPGASIVGEGATSAPDVG
ncbi:pyridine nucleotide-disulfide oxidoreductase family protein [Rubrobacter radiotolerans]|uniref:FAD-dependent oxidoreductase n=1 Tax=Rubrobacter radiotolerans TaxID=42256 RepID=A0A023X5M6_RUBRA|nr:FAD-dependent oxidoreductase [Rubrobacter radiotolerans]AHY47310.1 pyridine nucleotide-disulfide oxidoreductase family protein [Rubrobacter radiotolerans]MDX5894714.1 FAD-dependent oxidoreductase [Rubrobacter radiotolerans]SMC06589.1 NADH dehydrogenase, FAD-containing subunit [Rubrobacter radiotolerans DSM 5868]